MGIVFVHRRANGHGAVLFWDYLSVLLSANFNILLTFLLYMVQCPYLVCIFPGQIFADDLNIDL